MPAGLSQGPNLQASAPGVAALTVSNSGEELLKVNDRQMTFIQKGGITVTHCVTNAGNQIAAADFGLGTAGSVQHLSWPASSRSNPNPKPARGFFLPATGRPGDWNLGGASATRSRSFGLSDQIAITHGVMVGAFHVTHRRRLLPQVILVDIVHLQRSVGEASVAPVVSSFSGTAPWDPGAR